jgi:hypothetical protein
VIDEVVEGGSQLRIVRGVCTHCSRKGGVAKIGAGCREGLM